MTSHERHDVSNHWQCNYLCNSLFRLFNRENIKVKRHGPTVRGTAGVRSVKGIHQSGFPSQRASNVESIAMSWHHHVLPLYHRKLTCCIPWVGLKNGSIANKMYLYPFCTEVLILYVGPPDIIDKMVLLMACRWHGVERYHNPGRYEETSRMYAYPSVQ